MDDDTMILRTLMLAATLATLPTMAGAVILDFDFTGEVESVNDGSNANLPGGLGPYNVGDILNGSFLLDTSLMTGGSGTSAFYAGAVSNLSVTIDGNTYTSSGTGSAQVRNDNQSGSSAPKRDMFFATFTVNGPSAGGLAVSGFQFTLGGTNAYAAGSLSDVDAPTIAEFISLFNNDNNDGNTKILGFSDGSDVRYDVTGLTVRSVSAVPLPPSFLLLLIGLGILAAASRRSCARSWAHGGV
jgi:hypothetical protein